jgi:hypothetical protein
MTQESSRLRIVMTFVPGLGRKQGDRRMGAVIREREEEVFGRGGLRNRTFG